MNIHDPKFATPKVTTGALPSSRKVYARPDAAPDLRVPLREIVLTEPRASRRFRSTTPPGPTPIPTRRSTSSRASPAPASNGCASAAASRTTRDARSSRSTTATSPASTSPRNFPVAHRPLRAAATLPGEGGQPSPSSNGRAPASSPRR